MKANLDENNESENEYSNPILNEINTKNINEEKIGNAPYNYNEDSSINFTSKFNLDEKKYLKK